MSQKRVPKNSVPKKGPKNSVSKSVPKKSLKSVPKKVLQKLDRIDVWCMIMSYKFAVHFVAFAILVLATLCLCCSAVHPILLFWYD